MSPPGRPKGASLNAQHEGTPVSTPRLADARGRSPAAIGFRAVQAQRGAATLVIVMVMFFVMAMVAAYASRNLIFEQKTSANQYRSTQAFEAAQAGIEWALAMLNGGRIDAACVPSTNLADNSFRERYLSIDDAGLYTRRTFTPAATAVPLNPGCVRTAAGGLSCSCPASTTPALAAPAGPGSFPAFQLVFLGLDKPGTAQVTSYGCTQWNPACLLGQGAVSGDAAAVVSVVVSLARSLHVTPAAALTVRGDVAVGSAALRLHNTDPASGGLTLHAGGSLSAPNLSLVTAPGSLASGSTAVGDPGLAGMSAEQMFVSNFGMARGTYKRQPAAAVIEACTSGCAASLLAAARSRPGRVIWVEGDMLVDDDLVLGSVAEPVMLVVNGNVNLTAANVQITGVVYSQAAAWAHSGANALILGAAIAENSFTGSGALTVQFEPNVLSRIYRRQGSLVTVPGSWKDF